MQGLALLALAVVLVAAASSAPLFVRASADAAWEQDRSRIGEVSLGETVSTNTLAPSYGRTGVEGAVRQVPEIGRAHV